MRTVGQDSVWDIVQHGILPCMVLAFQNISVYMRYIRSSTIQQLEEDYVQFNMRTVLQRKQFYLITYCETY